MEVGAEYNKKKLHGKRYFYDLLGSMTDIPSSVLDLLLLSRTSLEMFNKMQRRLLNALNNHPAINKRVIRLQTFPGVGAVTALTWVLEVGDPQRFSTIKKAVSYCGLCSAQNESAGKSIRRPVSNKRNKHLQTVLIEAAKFAPNYTLGTRK